MCDQRRTTRVVTATLATSRVTAMRRRIRSCVFSLEKRAATCLGFACLPVLRASSAGTERRALTLRGLAVVRGKREILDIRQTVAVAVRVGGVSERLCP